MTTIVALTTSHNRKVATLRALNALQLQKLPSTVSLSICLVDDGSTDGTADAVRAAFPSVIVIEGSGDLYWAGGMRFGWREFVQKQDPEFLLVFNDDIAPSDYAIETLWSAASLVEEQGCDAYAVSGAFLDPVSGKLAYGGAVRSSRWHPLRFATIEPSDRIQACHTLNMNLALISRGALKSVGFLSADFTHGMADYDFGLRLRAAGGQVILAPGYVGECATNSLIGRSEMAGLSLREHWRRLTSVKEQPPAERAAFYRRHAGRLWMVFFALPYLHSPIMILKRFIARYILSGRIK